MEQLEHDGLKRGYEKRMKKTGGGYPPPFLGPAAHQVQDNISGMQYYQVS